MNYKDMIFNPFDDIDDSDDLMPEGIQVDYLDKNKVCYNLTKKAFEKGEVKDLILGNQVGDHDYRIIAPDFYRRPYTIEQDRGYIYVLPTDYFRLVKYGIHPFYKETQDERIISEIVSALDKIFEEGIPYDILSAFFFLRSLNNVGETLKLDLGPNIYKKGGEAINIIDWPFMIKNEFNLRKDGIKDDSGYDMGITIDE